MIFVCRISTFEDYISDLGHPYVWVQKLGGLQFSTDNVQVCVWLYKCLTSDFVIVLSVRWDRQFDVMSCSFQAKLTRNALSASHMERTMKLLRGRLQSRLALHKQFSSLGTHTWTQQTDACVERKAVYILNRSVWWSVPEHSIIPVSSECQHLFPAKVVTGLTRWTMMSYQEFTVRSYASRISLEAVWREFMFPSDSWEIMWLLSDRSWASCSICWRPVWRLRRISSSWLC